jgi:predicted Zn-dependent peptidase
MRASLLAVAVTLVACGGAPAPAPVVGPAPSGSAPPVASAAPADDPLGPRPEVPHAPAFVPPSPVVFTTANGLTVWLVERHTLPVVSVTVAMPYGASSDPPGKAGLARITADMLDEGAGKLGAIDLRKAVDVLGAHLGTSSDADSSFASLTVLKRNLDRALPLLGDVVAKPRLEAVEWRRVHDLWQNDLESRKSDPDAIARVVARVVLFGADNPYGHPWDGTVRSAKTITLADVKRFHASAWRPDRATIVVVGDVTRDETTKLVEAAFGGWKAPKGAPMAVVTPPAPAGPWPRVVVVDRPGAPQSVLSIVRPGVAASNPDAAALSRANDVLGGSFSSRLNQDLREAHGYSYGAYARLSYSRGVGMAIASAGVFTPKTGDAIKAMLADMAAYAKTGPTDAEAERSRSQARSEAVEEYESVHAIAGVLAANAALGLAPDFEGDELKRRDAATRDDLARLAATYLDPAHSIVVIVGPRGVAAQAAKDSGLPAPEARDSDGNVVTAKAP